MIATNVCRGDFSMPAFIPTEYSDPRVTSFIASVEGQDVLLGAIAHGFGHEDPTTLVAGARRVAAGWSDDRFSQLRSKIISGRIDVIGGNFDLKSALATLASALLGYRTPRGRSLEIGKILFAILDADVDDLGAWLHDIPPLLAPMGCNYESLEKYLAGRLPGANVSFHVITTPRPR